MNIGDIPKTATQGRYETLLREFEAKAGARGVNGADEAERILAGGGINRTSGTTETTETSGTEKTGEAPSIPPAEGTTDPDKISDVTEKLALSTTAHKTVMYSLYALMELLLEASQQLRNAMREERQAEVSSVQATLQHQADVQKEAATAQLALSASLAGVQMLASGVGLIEQYRAGSAENMGTNRLSEDLQAATDRLDTAELAVRGDQNAIDAKLGEMAPQFMKKEGAANPVQNPQANSVQKQNLNKSDAPKGSDKAYKDGQLHSYQVDYQKSDASHVELPKPDPSEPIELQSIKSNDLEIKENAHVDRSNVSNQNEIKNESIDAEKAGPKESKAVAGESGILEKVRKEIGLEDSQSAKAEGLRHEILNAKDGKTRADSFKKLTGKTLSESAANNPEEPLSNEELDLMNKSVRTGYDLDADALGKTDPSGRKVKMLRTLEARHLAEEGNKSGAEAYYSEALSNRQTAQANYDRGYRSARVDKLNRWAQTCNATSIMLGMLAQSLPSAIGQRIQADAVRLQAEQKSQEEMLDQNKDLFSNAMSVVNQVIQLFAEVTKVESETIRNIVA